MFKNATVFIYHSVNRECLIAVYKALRDFESDMNQRMWVELDGWQAKLRFSACHFIPNHPKCGRLHGHTYAMSVKIIGAQINHFVMDFEDLKQKVGDICDALDHKTLLASQDDDVHISYTRRGNVDVTVEMSRKQYRFPKEDVIILPISSVSAEDLCSYLLDELCKKLDISNVAEVSVRLDEGLGQGAGCVRHFPLREDDSKSS
jgi:6-pyruvoyltetrahydropterin/6-carboxytetrahydropterin synthase